MATSQIMASVENGSVDIGITYLFDKITSLETSTLYYDTFELVVSPEHSLANSSHMGIGALKEYSVDYVITRNSWTSFP